MVEALPSVALLFDDAELGAHLRQTLQERGARIVHEGTVAGFDAASLHQHDPDVLVVNLDENDDASFDRLFGMVEGDRPRLVLNDARASRALAGWDRARWARHLAVKVLASGDVDPPRPVDAPVVETPVAAVAEAPAPEQAAAEVHAPHDQAATREAEERAASNDLEAELAALLAAPESVAAPADAQGAHEHAAPDSVDTGDLEAELSALLASHADLPDDEAAAPTAPRRELPLHDGDFGIESPAVEPPAAETEAPPVQPEAPPPQEREFGFTLHADDVPAATFTNTTAQSETPAAPVVPDGWALVDHDEMAAHADHEPEGFGIEKLSAADFLAPEAEPIAPEFKPTMSLELVSMEEAVAPQTWERPGASEMLLDDLDGALSRVVLLGAAADGLDSVCEFLASLPASARHAILLTQHFGAQPVDAVLQRLSSHSSLPVKLAEQDGRMRHGEVLLAPATAQVQLRRDGSVELREHGEERQPSIDASFSMGANTFGRDALGIVFAGRSTDAVAGAQAIHDRGGEVWVESTGGYAADMVSGIFAERLVSHSGTSQELAAHLIEVYP